MQAVCEATQRARLDLTGHWYRDRLAVTLGGTPGGGGVPPAAKQGGLALHAGRRVGWGDAAGSRSPMVQVLVGPPAKTCLASS